MARFWRNVVEVEVAAAQVQGALALRQHLCQMPAVFDCVLTVRIGGDDAARRREMRLNIRIAGFEGAAFTAIDLMVRDGHAVHRVQFGKNRLIGGAAAVINNHNMLETLVQQAADVCGQAVIRLKGGN